VHEVETYATPWAVSASSPSNVGEYSADEQLFHSYWTSTNLATYRTYFQAGEYPPLEAADFEAWLAVRNARTHTVYGRIRLSLNGYSLSLMQYAYMGSNGKLQRTVFMAKKVGGAWYACSPADNQALGELKYLFAHISAEGLGYLFGENDPPVSENDFAAFGQLVMIGNDLSPAQLITHSRAYLKTGEAPKEAVIRSVFFPEYVEHEKAQIRVITPADWAEHSELKTYMSRMGLTQEQEDNILRKILNGEYVEAAGLLQSYTYSPHLRPFSEEIRRMYGEDKIFLLDTYPENENGSPNSNDKGDE